MEICISRRSAGYLVLVEDCGWTEGDLSYETVTCNRNAAIECRRGWGLSWPSEQALDPGASWPVLGGMAQKGRFLRLTASHPSPAPPFLRGLSSEKNI